MKIYTLIGGVNGAGKSSLTGSLRSERSDFGVVIDPDKLTLQCGGDEYEGGKLAVERIERALEDGVNFTQETTLSGGYPKRLCKRAKEAGYYIRLYYVGLDTAEESIRRIRNRVERGGHDIPVKDVEARFSHRFEDVLKVLPYCDEAKFFDNDNGFVLVAEFLLERIGPHGSANFLYSPLNIFAAHLRMGGIFVWPNFPLQTKKRPFWNSSPLLLRRVTSSASGKNSGKTSSTLKPQSCEFLQPMSREYVSPYQTSTYKPSCYLLQSRYNSCIKIDKNIK